MWVLVVTVLLVGGQKAQFAYNEKFPTAEACKQYALSDDNKAQMLLLRQALEGKGELQRADCIPDGNDT